ncbi:MAG TPA: hypothetical protein VMU84_02955 [Thermoanaerobaculia bacterium]|nr:hypothetical protein [Thermoanaerobaculia bacterium]
MPDVGKSADSPLATSRADSIVYVRVPIRIDVINVSSPALASWIATHPAHAGANGDAVISIPANLQPQSATLSVEVSQIAGEGTHADPYVTEGLLYVTAPNSIAFVGVTPEALKITVTRYLEASAS